MRMAFWFEKTSCPGGDKFNCAHVWRDLPNDEKLPIVKLRNFFGINREKQFVILSAVQGHIELLGFGCRNIRKKWIYRDLRSMDSCSNSTVVADVSQIRRKPIAKIDQRVS